MCSAKTSYLIISYFTHCNYIHFILSEKKNSYDNNSFPRKQSEMAVFITFICYQYFYCKKYKRYDKYTKPFSFCFNLACAYVKTMNWTVKFQH